MTDSSVQCDPDNLGEIDFHASGTRPSADGGWGSWPHDATPQRPPFMILAEPATLVPPWDASTWDGYDIYAGNWPVDPAVVPALPIGVHKASEGVGTYDARFAQWVRDTAQRHRYRGAYHVIWPWRAGKADNYIEQQADSFLTFTRNSGVDWSEPGWFLQIDNEQFSGMPRVANEDEVRRFADYLIARIGPRVTHYCNPVTDPTLFFSTTLQDLPKWEAQYNRNASRAPTIIRQWGGWPCPGIWDGRAVDANFIEKENVLEDVAGYTTPQPPDPIPEGATAMGQHLGWLQLTDDAGNTLAGVYGELMMNYDTSLARTSTVGDGIGVFGFPLGRAAQSAYNALPNYDADADIRWFFSHQPGTDLSAITAQLNTIQSAVVTTIPQQIAGIAAQINTLSAAVSNGFATTNNNITLVGASVAVCRQQLDALKTTCDAILAAVNALPGGGTGDCDLTPVLDEIAKLSSKLDNLQVKVNLATTGTAGPAT